jgi:cell shape-determining protein MreC
MRFIIEGEPVLLGKVKRMLSGFNVNVSEESVVKTDGLTDDHKTELLEIENKALKKALTEAVGLEAELAEVKAELKALKSKLTPIEKSKAKSKKVA